MTIFNPTSGETNERDRLLSLLMEWTTEPRLLTAMVRQKRADFPGLAQLAAMVRATLDGKPSEGEVQAQPLDERQIAAACLAFLLNDGLRKVVADYVSRAHSVPYLKAKDDLLTLRIHLGTTYALQPEDVPTLFAGDGDVERAGLEANVSLHNPNLRWPKADPTPDWALEYAATEPATLSPAAVTYLRQMEPAAQEVAKAFPPYSLVRATQEILCPAPDHVAIVKGYEIEDGVVVVMVSSFLDKGAARVAAKPEWLELAICRGGVTPEAVAAALVEVVAS